MKDLPQRVTETSGHVEQTSLPDVPIFPARRKKRRKHLKEKEDTGEVQADPQIEALAADGAGPDLRLESKEDDEHKDDEEHKEHTVGELGESEPSPVRNPLTAAPVESKVTEPVLPPDTLAAATAAKELPAVPADHLPEANQHVTPVAPGELKPTQTEAMDASNRPKTLGSHRSPPWASRPSRPTRPSRSRSTRRASPRAGLQLQLRSAPRSRSRRLEPQAKVKGGCAISPKRDGSADPPHRRERGDRAKVSKASRSRRDRRLPRRPRRRSSRGSRAVAVLFEAGTLHRPRLGAGGRRGDPNGGLRGGRYGGRPGLTGTTGDGQILQDGCKVDPERKMWGTR